MRLVASLLLCMLTSAVYGQMGFQVEPPKLYFEEQQGKFAPTRVKISNTGPVRMLIRASCMDWRRDSLGDKQFYPAGTLGSSCCPYLRIQPETIELAPGTQQDVLVSLEPGKNPGGTLRNAMLMLTQLNEKEIADAQGQKSGFIIKVQLGVHVYHVPAAAKSRMMAIDSLCLAQVKATQSANVLVNNVGELPLESELRIELTNLVTAEETKLPSVPVNTMPGEKIWVKSPLPDKLPKGRYLVIALIESGTDVPLQVAEFETDIQ